MDSNEFAIASADTLLDGLAHGRWRAVDLIDASLARIDALDQRGPKLRAMTTVASDEARAAAAESDVRRARGKEIRPLEGIPVLVKDNMDVAGWPTTAGSVRIPAAFNHLYGLRATRGTMPLDGIVPLSPTQDMPGPLARYPADVERVHAVLSDQAPVPAESATTLYIGCLDSWFDAQTFEAMVVAENAWNALAQLAHAGLTSRSVAFDDLRGEAEAANVIAYEFNEALTAHLTTRPGRRVDSLQDILEQDLQHPQLTDVFRDRAAHAGTDSLAYADTCNAQARLREQLVAYMNEQGLDLLAYPTVRYPATRLGGTQAGSNALLAPVTGLPAINLPVGFDLSGAPTGLELLARPNAESLLFAAARVWQTVAKPWTMPVGL